MKTNKEILLETYNLMENTFSSNQFCSVFVHQGGLKQYVSNGYCLKFLKSKCDPLGLSEKRTRSWKKRNIDSKSIQIPLNYELNEEMCIEFLKKRDYKIYKIQTIEL